MNYWEDSLNYMNVVLVAIFPSKEMGPSYLNCWQNEIGNHAYFPFTSFASRKCHQFHTSFCFCMFSGLK